MKILLQQSLVSCGCTLYYMNEETKKMETYSKAPYVFSDFQEKSPGIKQVDPTGAGDAFIAGFAIGLLESENSSIQNLDNLKSAIDLGCKTAFLNISKYGASPAMPTRAEIDALFGN